MKWVYNPFTGKLDASVNPFDQSLNTTDSPTFADLNNTGQFSLQNGNFVSSTDGTGNFLSLSDPNYYQINFLNTSGNGAGDWHVGPYNPYGQFDWYNTHLGRSMFSIVDGSKNGGNPLVHFYDNVQVDGTLTVGGNTLGSAAFQNTSAFDPAGAASSALATATSRAIAFSIAF
jgi:hypothetical protein